MKLQCSEVQAPENIALCMQVRHIVFTEGQGVPEHIQVDGEDGRCVHFLGALGKTPVATLRIRRDKWTAEIQRVAVLEDYRHTGAGRAIMEEAINWCRTWNYKEIILGAQVNVIGFYEKLGFEACGERYTKATIEHQPMKLLL